LYDTGQEGLLLFFYITKGIICFVCFGKASRFGAKEWTVTLSAFQPSSASIVGGRLVEGMASHYVSFVF
jgi:hypothetical protein